MARVLVGLLLVTVLAYAPLRTAEFVYEDRDPLSTVDLSRFADQRGPWTNWDTERKVFELGPRMLSNLTIRMQGWARAKARGYHAFNVSVHLLNGVLLYAVLAPFGAGVAVIGSGLFLLHPINAEAVSYVSARPDLLYATAVLLMLIVSRWANWAAVAGVTLLAGCAVLAKESAIVVVGLLPVWLWVQGRWSTRWAWALVAWTLGGLLVIFHLVHIPWCVSTPGSPCFPVSSHWWGAIALYTSAAAYGPIGYAAHQAGALWRYLGLVAWPIGFSIDHDFGGMSRETAAAALGGLIGLVVAAWRYRSRFPWLAFAVAWLVGGLSLRFVLPMPEYLHEQHLYVPLIGVWIALAASVGSLLSPAPRTLQHG